MVLDTWCVDAWWLGGSVVCGWQQRGPGDKKNKTEGAGSVHWQVCGSGWSDTVAVMLVPLDRGD
jgi:hypothetical protein